MTVSLRCPHVGRCWLTLVSVLLGALGGASVAQAASPPVVTTDSGSASFVAGDNTLSTPVVVDSGLTVADGSSATLASATVVITGNFDSAEDVLAFTNTSSATYGNIAASYDASTGVLALTSSGASATLAQWQAALESVAYTDTALTPNSATRTVSFTVVAGDGTTGNTATRTVTVTDVDQTPIVTTTGGTTSYVAGGPATTIDSDVTVTDRDDGTQSSATVSITSGFHSGDTLDFSNTGPAGGSIVGSYNAATGVLTLASAGATATDAQWSSALSAVRFSASATATTGMRTISFAANDGTKTSAAATDSVQVTALPGAPTAVDATAGDGEATVSWSAPSSAGGATITGYTVTSSDGGHSCEWRGGPLSCTVEGLSNGTSYTFAVTTTTGVGTGPASAPSNAVTPTAPPTATSPTISTATSTPTPTATSTPTPTATSNPTPTTTSTPTPTPAPTRPGTPCKPVAGAGSVSGTLGCGATVSIAHGGAWVTVSAGTFSRPVRVSLTRVSGRHIGGATSGPISLASGSLALRLTVTSLADGTHIVTFRKPLVIHLPAHQIGVPADSPDGTAWQSIPRLTTSRISNRTITGYVRGRQGSIDIYTRRASYVGLLTPAAPVQLAATLRNGVLWLNWHPGRGGLSSDYLIRSNGHTLIATSRTHIGLNIRKYHFDFGTTRRLRITAVGAGRRAPGAGTVTLSPMARPAGAPLPIPQWAWQLMARNLRRATVAPAAPTLRPTWYDPWQRWWLDRYSIRVS